MTNLQTKRFQLRSPRIEDAERITGYVNDPRIHEMVARIRPGQTVEETGRWILSVERGNDRGTDHVFVIEEEGDLIGTVGAHRRPANGPFEIGYWIAPHAWGRGVATEVAAAIIGWLEQRGQGAEIISGHFKDNPASGRVLEKLGFVPTHQSPVFCAGRGRDIDHVYMVRRTKAE